MYSRSTVVSQITELASGYCHDQCIVALVGSSSPLNKEVVGQYSDIDLVVIEEGGSALDAFVDLLHDSISRDWRIIRTWGIVSPAWLGTPAVHIHGTDANTYCGSSSLFRRSVAKYPSQSGRGLCAFSPNSPISREELLTDRLGVLSLAERLNGVRLTGFALEVDEPRAFSSRLDISIYCVLHSVRNTLRWLGQYEEFSRVDALTAMWNAAGGENVDILDRFVRLKHARRDGQTCSQNEEIVSATEAQYFLTTLAEWILKA